MAVELSEMVYIEFYDAKSKKHIGRELGVKGDASSYESQARDILSCPSYKGIPNKIMVVVNSFVGGKELYRNIVLI
jgi:hypothetical protein